ncbi:MAG: hypothetical protein AAFY72_19165, partial [Cyanobacteria bacterium J06649_4]
MKLSSHLSDQFFDQVGHFNPQLLREWQGRLRWRNFLMTFVLSFFVQAVVVLQRLAQLPTSKFSGMSRYCLEYDYDAGCTLSSPKG